MSLSTSRDSLLIFSTIVKDAFAVFAENRQQYPLVYETSWKGVVSSASYTTGE